MAELPPQVADVIGERNFAHLATLEPDGAPSVRPLWVDVEEDRVIFVTQLGSRKAAAIERDPRVALSIADRRDPYRQIDLRGRVVDRIDGDAALVLADRIARKYTGDPFPLRGEATVIFVIEADEARHTKLPFTDEG
ncbi:MAG TPA: TIGR03618 family F420-dependent PPOX class oxidoreductase [Miltoncostaeaceae bacterium]|nr:TIGR03618 family F420-dependent PPOX class oxidoreductase [Miltoncostaeaceae bacterium]